MTTVFYFVITRLFIAEVIQLEFVNNYNNNVADANCVNGSEESAQGAEATLL